MATTIMSWSAWKTDRPLIKKDVSRLRVDYKCGGHVHVDWDRIVHTSEDKGVKVMRRLFLMIDKVNGSIHNHLEIDTQRRGTGYCKSYPSQIFKLFKEDYSSFTRSSERYRWLNLCNITKTDNRNKNTLEFRIFDATASIVQAENNIAWAIAFVCLAQHVSRASIEKMSPQEILAAVDHIALKGLDRVFVEQVVPQTEKEATSVS